MSVKESRQSNANELSSSASDTVVSRFLRTVEQNPDGIAIRSVDGQVSQTWSQVCRRIEPLAAGLSKLGVKAGDTVALMLKSRPEALFADVAVMFLRAAPFSIYATLPPPHIVHMLNNSDATVVMCEQEFLKQVLAARATCENLKTIIVLEGGGPDGTLDWADVEKSGASGIDLKAAAAAVKPSDLVTLIYTSGTTGNSKGVELIHAGVVEVVEANHQLLNFEAGQRFISWLPMAHMGERAATYYPALLYGCTLTFCEDPQKVLGVVSHVHPHVFFSPPRLWEKLKAAIEAKWAALPAEQHTAVLNALRLGYEKVRLEQDNQPVPPVLAQHYAQADQAFFAPLREALGFDAEHLYISSGGASAMPSLLEFFFAIGLPIGECYGMTESSALGTRNARGEMRIGTVGKAQPGVEVKLALDGEVLIRSPGIMHGYRKQPEETAIAIDAEGWLHTGDIGVVDADGYFIIVDRKKDLIINTFGKNMSPANIEAALIGSGPFIAQAVAIGDGRNYNVALVTLDTAYLAEWAASQELHDQDMEALLFGPEVRAEVEAQVHRANEQLARVEQIKKFTIVGGEWMPGSEEVTVTMKRRRYAILTKYAAEIEAMYDEKR